MLFLGFERGRRKYEPTTTATVVNRTKAVTVKGSGMVFMVPTSMPHLVGESPESGGHSMTPVEALLAS